MPGNLPSVEVVAGNGSVIMKAGLSICFYMRRSHRELAPLISQALRTYIQAVGRQALTWYPDLEGEWRVLDDSALESIHQELLTHSAPYIHLRDSYGSLIDHQFLYRGVDLDSPESRRAPGLHTCAVSFWLPAQPLQPQGPGPFRELALSLAKPLPFNSGHAGPTFHAWLGMKDLMQHMFQLGLRYPGLDVPDERNNAYSVGEGIQGVHWMNFLGPPVLEALGGASALEARLQTPGTSVLALGEDRAVVTLGAEPDAGDTAEGRMLPAHRELARILEPWFAAREGSRRLRDNDALRRWERRFLD
ncbi:type VI immunity family protein [Corallococcus coralloides]|uniref:type VI immunity family protein n=1 Tax=Corallococcus coralloides TaxID=184914 RepID=UPI003850A037